MAGTLILGNQPFTVTGSFTLTASGTVTTGGASGFVIGNLQKPIAAGSSTVNFEVGTAGTSSAASVVFAGVTAAGSSRSRQTSPTNRTSPPPALIRTAP